MSEATHRVRPLATALTVMTILALLGATLLTAIMNRSLPHPEPFIIEADQMRANSSDPASEPLTGTIAVLRGQSDSATGSSDIRGALILFADTASPRLSGRLLAAAMADVGILTVIIPISADHFDQVPLQHVLDWVKTRTGISASETVLAGQGGVAAGLAKACLEVAAVSRPRQLILIAPAETGAQLTSRLAALPRAVMMTLIVGNETTMTDKARAYFLAASGEDADLIPGIRGMHELSAERILSADGQRRLVILPAFSKLNEGWSPRLHQSLQQALVAGITGLSAEVGPVSTLYNRLLMPIWALMLLFLAPLFLTLTRSVMAAAAFRSTKTADTPAEGGSGAGAGPDVRHASGPGFRPGPGPGVWLELLLYLPAAVAAVPAGRWLASLAADTRLADGFGFYVLIGIHGWLLLLLHRFRPSAGDRSSTRSGFQAAATGRTVIFGLLFLTAIIFWITTVYGPGLLRERLDLLLVPIALVLAPSMLSACIGYRRTRHRQRLFHTLAHLAVPVLYLGIVAFVLGRATLAGITSGILFLIAGRVVAKALSWDPAPQLIASAAGAWLMLILWPLPLL